MVWESEAVVEQPEIKIEARSVMVIFVGNGCSEVVHNLPSKEQSRRGEESFSISPSRQQVAL
jgi:hypothetical protein